jgi:tetratricopeptide (TPR) repeat protein
MRGLRTQRHRSRKLGTLLTITLLSGCATLPPAERQSLIEAARMYEQGQAAAAVQRLDPIITHYGQVPETAEAYYVRALCRIESRSLPGAKQDLEQARGLSQRRDLTARVEASLATMAYQEGDFARAADLYASAMPELPDRPPKDQMLYHAGVCLRRAGRWDDAALKFGQILWKFRDRPIAAEARRLAAWPHPFYSIQIGAFHDAQHADEAIKAARGKGLTGVWSENQPRGGYAMWIALAGKHLTYAEAQRGLQAVRPAEQGAFIVPSP